MNRDHLADAYDFWKAACVGFMSGMASRDKRYVLPMLTDAPRWSKTELDLYAALAGVERKHVLKADVTYTGKTEDYFTLRRVQNDAVIFVDPDTGVQPNGGHGAGHLPMAGIGQLLADGERRVLLIYQHAFRDRDYAQAVIERLLHDKGINGARHVFAYKAGAVSMIVVSGD